VEEQVVLGRLLVMAVVAVVVQVMLLVV